jgi:hypothetical protein
VALGIWMMLGWVLASSTTDSDGISDGLHCARVNNKGVSCLIQTVFPTRDIISTETLRVLTFILAW